MALEYMLYGSVERVTKVVTEALHSFSSERGIEWVNAAERLSIDELLVRQRKLQAIAPIPTEKLDQLQLELVAVDHMNVDEQVKRMSYLSVLADK